MNQTIRGIIVHKVHYKDNSFICKIYLEHYGLKAFIVYSGKSQKSSKVNLLAPLMLVEFESDIRENIQIHHLKDLRTAIPLHDILLNPVKATILLFLNEVLYKTIPDDYINDRLFKFLWNSVKLLDDAIDARNFHIWSLLEISRQYGFYPFIEMDIPRYFDLSTASFTASVPNHHYFIEGESCLALLKIIDKEWPQVQAIALHSSIRKELLESMVMFLKLHLENLKEIQSLKILHEVFH